MADISKTSVPTKVDDYALPLTSDLRTAAKEILDFSATFFRQDKDPFFLRLEFETQRAMENADLLLIPLAIRISASFESLNQAFLLYEKLFIDHLSELLLLHLQWRDYNYPQQFRRSGSALVPIKDYYPIANLYNELATETHDSPVLNHQLKLMRVQHTFNKLKEDFKRLHNQFNVYHQCQDFSRSLEMWQALNSVLCGIDDCRQKILDLDHRARTAFGINVKFFEGIRLRIHPVRLGWVTGKSINMSAQQCLPEEILSFCKILTRTNVANDTIAVGENLIDLAKYYEAFFHCDGLTAIYPIESKRRSERGPHIDSGTLKDCTVALVNLFRLITSPGRLPAQISKALCRLGESKGETVPRLNKAKKNEPLNKHNASKTYNDVYTVNIKNVTQVVVNGKKVSNKKPCVALLGLAVLNRSKPTHSLSFSTVDFVNLVHWKSPGTSFSQLFGTYKDELKAALPKISIEGDKGQYTISGLQFRTELSLEEIENWLADNKCGRHRVKSDIENRPALKDI